MKAIRNLSITGGILVLLFVGFGVGFDEAERQSNTEYYNNQVRILEAAIPLSALQPPKEKIKWQKVKTITVEVWMPKKKPSTKGLRAPSLSNLPLPLRK